MYLFDKLPQEDIHQLWKYLEHYSDGSAISESRMSHFLRFWNEAKEPFFRMFGEQFIIKKDIYFEKPCEELEEEMDDAMHYNDSFVSEFRDVFSRRVCELYPFGHDDSYRLCLFVNDMHTLVKNQYDGPAILIPGEMTKNGKPMQVNSGCKVVKMVGKIADALGISVNRTVCDKCGSSVLGDRCSNPDCDGKPKVEDGYEQFRRAHSLVLNQKKIKGRLCLSLHPLDYLTMSDNDCGWTSCMSWMEEYGDYRLGTIEMMNSPCVVIAYVEASDDMMVCGRPWNNKRWRQLYIVTPELILGNKQYPYSSDMLQGTAIKWLRDLCTSAIGWGPYAEEACQIHNKAWNTINGTTPVKFDLYTNYMYNDIYDSKLAYVGCNWEYDQYYDLNISGVAVCTGCGDEIPYDTIDANRVQCRACDGSWKCDCCGDWHSEYDSSYSVGDYIYCDWCYHNELDTCECCEETVAELTHVYIQCLDTQNEEITSSFNYSYYVGVCYDCLDNPKRMEKLFGPLHEVTDMWGHRRYAFDVTKITEAGLLQGDLSDDVIEFIKAVGAAKSDEDRLALIRKFSY
jgi:hypothetical protein